MISHLLQVSLPMLPLLLLAGCGVPTQEPILPVNPPAVMKPEMLEGADTEREVADVSISFAFTRMSTKASNQLAVWVEDDEGDVVKTLFATDFTAVRRGYRNRPDALSGWVTAVDPGSKSDEELDALSGATPASSTQSFSWDMTDEMGNRVPDGVYRVMVEGTLYWSSNVIYAAEFDTATMTAGVLEVAASRSEPENTQNETMIQDVKIELEGKEP